LQHDWAIIRYRQVMGSSPIVGSIFFSLFMQVSGTSWTGLAATLINEWRQ
jgi:hypothetical protein